MIEFALLSWFLNQPVHSTDTSEPDRLSRLSQVSEAIGVVSAGNRLLAATLAVMAVEESGLRRDVHHGECPALLCDRGRARGLWQLHRHPVVPRDVWMGWAGDEYSNTLSAATQAAAMLRAGFARCGTQEGAISYYATGGSCRWTGASDRAEKARRLAGKL